MAVSLPSVLLAAASLLAAAVYIRSYDTVGTTTTTHLHFFMHDDYTGPRPTAARVVSGRSLLPTSSSQGGDGDGDGDDTSKSTVLPGLGTSFTATAELS